MAIKLTYEHFRTPGFHQALAKLMNAPLPTKAAYSLAKVDRKIRKEMEIAQELFEKIVNKYAKKDEKGEIEPLPDQPGTFQIPKENQEAYKKELDEMHANTIEVDVRQVSLKDLERAQLSARDMSLLDPIITEIEIVEAGEAPKLVKA